MSGIAAIIDFSGAPAAPGAIDAMTRAMRRRGPDGVAHLTRDFASFGHCMFRTTPESLEEAQPLQSESGDLVLVMDGRLDNWAELRGGLLAKGVRLRDRSDAELLLKAYESWGEGCLARIDGDFAFLVFDRRRKTAFCARDHLGAKPLYYAWSGRRLCVASDISGALAALDPQPKLNDGMIAELLAGEWLSDDETVWRGVMRLPAAHALHVGETGVRIERYWRPPLDRLIRYRRDEDYFEHYREVFFDCVRRCARAAAPLAVEVSGGLDSTAVFCAAQKLRTDGRLPAPSLSGYALAFQADGDDDELQFIRATADHTGASIHEIEPTFHSLSWFEAHAKEERDFPGFPNGAIFMGLRRAMTQAGARVVLNGEGGDEWASGSLLHYAEDIVSRDWRGLSESFRADAAKFGMRRAAYWLARHGIFHQLPEPLKALARRIGNPSRENVHSGGYWLSKPMRALLEERRAAAAHRETHAPLRDGQRALLAQLNGPFSAYLKEWIDRDAASHGVEARSPMYRRAFVEFALATPDRMRLRGGVDKYMHRAALATILPPKVARRNGKADFAFVFRRYLDEMRPLLVEAIPRERPDLVDSEGVAKLYEAYCDRTQYNGAMWELWGIFACGVLPSSLS